MERPILTQLRVENLLLIELAVLDLADGFNVITGETGAGKTMLTRALDLLLGARADRTVVRPGARETFVEATFTVPGGWLRTHAPHLDDLVDLDAEEITLARRVTAAGRSRALVDGRTVTVEALRDVSARLIAFYGQHEQRQLMLEHVQASMLDRAGDGKGVALYEAYRKARRAALDAERARRALQEQASQQQRELDLARFELAELDELDPRPGEEQELLEELRRLSLAGQAGQACEVAMGALDGEQHGARAAVAAAERALRELDDPQARTLADRLSALDAELDDITREAFRLSESWPADPAREDEVARRLSTLQALSRKHRCSADELADRRAQLAEQVGRDDALPAQLEQAEARAAETLAATLAAGEALARWRAKAARALAKAVTADLPSLAFQGARFEVQLRALEGDGWRRLGEQGTEQVVFLLQANPGLPMEELARAASGGEASRLMLALIAHCPTVNDGLLVLDEPDAGIGGQTAHGVAQRLAHIGERQQVLVVSHLAQIAGRARAHFALNKHTSKDHTSTELYALEGEEARIDELCRMAGHDSADEDARKLAAGLLR